MPDSESAAPAPKSTHLGALWEKTTGHPAGLSTLFFTEMWERASYYGMRALLVLFMTKAVVDGGMGMDDKTAGIIYGAAGIDSATDGARGFDHGTFVPMKLAYPEADVPVQLTLDP